MFRHIAKFRDGFVIRKWFIVWWGWDRDCGWWWSSSQMRYWTVYPTIEEARASAKSSKAKFVEFL